MNLTSEQLRADRDLRFADRGLSALLRPVAQSFTPETQHVAETGDETSIVLIPLDLVSSPLPQTGGQYAAPVQRFLIRVEDVPTEHPVPTLRVMLFDEAATEFDVISARQADDGLTVELTCRQRF